MVSLREVLKGKVEVIEPSSRRCRRIRRPARPRAGYLPLADFIDEVMVLFQQQPTPREILVQRVAFQRNAEAEHRYRGRRDLERGRPRGGPCSAVVVACAVARARSVLCRPNLEKIDAVRQFQDPAGMMTGAQKAGSCPLRDGSAGLLLREAARNTMVRAMMRSSTAATVADAVFDSRALRRVQAQQGPGSR